MKKDAAAIVLFQEIHRIALKIKSADDGDFITIIVLVDNLNLLLEQADAMLPERGGRHIAYWLYNVM